MEQPLVSVITITRNRGNLLKRCISSVLSQTYSKIEHIVVDGASDDNTSEVVSKFNDERLKYIKLDTNLSWKKTQEIALDKSVGKYITFLDDDDEYMPTKIEKQVRLIESLPDDYGMVYCWMTYFDSSKDNAFMRVHDTKLRGFVPIDAVETPSVSGTPTFMFRRHVFDELGGWIDGIPLSTDWVLGARCCQKWKVDYIPESLVNVYVNHEYERQSTKFRYGKAYLEKRIGMHEWFLRTFKDVYDKRIGSRWYQYKSLSFFCLKNHEWCKTIKYSLLYVINITEHRIYERFCRS